MLGSCTVRRKARWWLAAALSVGAAAVLVVLYVRAERASVEGLQYWSDIAFLDDYAAELGLVMSRARGGGPEPERFAARVDGPGPDIETLDLRGSAYDGGATVVLRLRRERPVREFFSTGEPETYQLSACYRWTFGGPDGRDHQPERLSACPDHPVIDVEPPIEPDVPPGLHEALTERLWALVASGKPVTETAVATAVRSVYAEQERKAAAADVEPAEILNGDDILTGDDWIVTIDNVIGVAIGRWESCVTAAVGPGEDVDVWTPDRMVLVPGEVGCSASWAARRGLS